MKNFDLDSFYNWPNFSKKTLYFNQKIFCEIIEDFLVLHEWFNEFNSLINHYNPKKDFHVEIENKLNSLNLFFTIALIENEDHKAHLEDIILDMVRKTMNSKKSSFERAQLIYLRLQEEILKLQ